MSCTTARVAGLGWVRSAKPKAKATLGWVPQIALQEMVTEMVASDLTDAQRHALLKTHGYATAVSSEH